MAEYVIRYKKNHGGVTPWGRAFFNIRGRCEKKTTHRYESYGGRGIKCLITQNELLALFIRDMAWKQIRPSVDRIDPDGNYTYDNVRWVALSNNVRGPRCRGAWIQYQKPIGPNKAKLCVECSLEFYGKQYKSRLCSNRCANRLMARNSYRKRFAPHLIGVIKSKCFLRRQPRPLGSCFQPRPTVPIRVQILTLALCATTTGGFWIAC